MKTNYFTKVENKYVFNLSLIFWHIFIAISTMVIVASIVLFLWSTIPPSQKNVFKKAYPPKAEYPGPIKVDLNELQLVETKEEAPPLIPEQNGEVKEVKSKQVEDLTGKGDYDSILNVLKTLIPPSKYSWDGSGYYSYPYGERYWTFYKQEKYRQWNSTESGLEDKLKAGCYRANANNYNDRTVIIGGFIQVLKPLLEEKRLIVLQVLINNVADNISQNLSVCQSLSKVVIQMPKQENTLYINQLSLFGKRNPNDGPLFIEYVSTIINKFDVAKRAEIIDKLILGYNNYFSNNLAMVKEATDLFLPLIQQIKVENLPKVFIKYFGVFRNKNYSRDKSIAEIDNEYQKIISEIENQYAMDELKAKEKYYSDKMSKSEYRLKSLAGMGGGILFIVLIAVVLVFFSIQRSVKNIENTMSMRQIE